MLKIKILIGGYGKNLGIEFVLATSLRGYHSMPNCAKYPR